LLGLIEELREHPPERALVVVDSEGAVGWDTYCHLRDLAGRPGATYELHRVRAGERAHRERQTYVRVRDELAGELGRWMREGGAILEDEQLESELHALEWEREPDGRSKITAKKALRKMLGRSPDSYDALAMAVWPVLSDADDSDEVGSDDDDDEDGLDIDPYANDGIDPYG